MIHLQWEDIRNGLDELGIDKEGVRVYGVPRGGMCAASALKHARLVHLPEDADIILDDIIDSGRTRDKWKKLYPGKEFLALVDKSDGKWNDWFCFPWEPKPEEDIQEAVARQIQFIGDDVAREGLQETPERVVKSWGKIFGGYSQKPEDVLKIFNEPCDEMVLLKDIEFYSTCEHHLQPFFGKAHIAYLPTGRVVGISKLARLLEIYTRRLQIQERIGQQVTGALNTHLNPLGSACVLEAKHFCMVCRGVEKQNSTMVTSSLTGVFREDAAARSELFNLIR